MQPVAGVADASGHQISMWRASKAYSPMVPPKYLGISELVLVAACKFDVHSPIPLPLPVVLPPLLYCHEPPYFDHPTDRQPIVMWVLLIGYPMIIPVSSSFLVLSAK